MRCTLHVHPPPRVKPPQHTTPEKPFPWSVCSHKWAALHLTCLAPTQREGVYRLPHLLYLGTPSKFNGYASPSTKKEGSCTGWWQSVIFLLHANTRRGQH